METPISLVFHILIRCCIFTTLSLIVVPNLGQSIPLLILWCLIVLFGVSGIPITEVIGIPSTEVIGTENNNE